MVSWFKISYNNNKAKVAHCDHPIESSARSVQWNHSIYPPCNQHIPSRLALSRWFSGVHRFCRISTPSLIGYSSVSLSSYTTCKISNHQPTVIFLMCFIIPHTDTSASSFWPAVMFRVLLRDSHCLSWTKRQFSPGHGVATNFLGGGKKIN